MWQRVRGNADCPTSPRGLPDYSPSSVRVLPAEKGDRRDGAQHLQKKSATQRNGAQF